jgi:hypothetical protein
MKNTVAPGPKHHTVKTYSMLFLPPEPTGGDLGNCLVGSQSDLPREI